MNFGLKRKILGYASLVEFCLPILQCSGCKAVAAVTLVTAFTAVALVTTVRAQLLGGLARPEPSGGTAPPQGWILSSACRRSWMRGRRWTVYT